MTSTNTYTDQSYVVYHITYSGDKLPSKFNSNITPLNYIGSTSIKQINKGYMGSVTSKIYKSIWDLELKENPHLFILEIISYHDTRSNATYRELQVQQIFNVVKNPLFVNMSYAKPNGFFGSIQPGVNHPQYGKQRSTEQNKHNSKIQKDPIIQNKKKATSLLKYGVDHPSKSIKFQNAKKRTNKIKYGVESPNSDINVKLKQAETKRNKLIKQFGCNSQKEIFDKIFIFEEKFQVKRYFKSRPNLTKILKYFPMEAHKSKQFLQHTYNKFISIIN